jgi:diaminohydroxyphosphoribosylaminopyrimidine deaminase/5-amino-6-(5-phosphoribosylamino)uracil reductase
MVGCVIVRDGNVIGEGWHKKAGQPHAEVNAVRAAGGDIRGATVYVTLEPCSHHGRTPPCADLLVKTGPARVVAAMRDPNPQVAGRGLARLRAAGIEVTSGVLRAAAKRQNEVFIKHITTGMPFVIAKCGMSLDGKLATRTGDSQWITGPVARQKVHALRNEVDAIMVGSRTVMVDDPSLTVRLDSGKIKDPIRVILDSGEYLDASRRVFNLKSATPTWVAVPDDRDFTGADDTLHIPRAGDGLDMRALMLELGRRGVTSVLIEGGGATLASAFEAGVVDKVMFFIAPKIIGGADAVSAVEGQGVASLSDAVQLKDMKAHKVGCDILIEAYVAEKRM